MVTISKNGPASDALLPGGSYGFRAGLARRRGFGLLEILLTWQQRLADRATLAGMSEARLRDIGLTRAETSREVEKPFWRS